MKSKPRRAAALPTPPPPDDREPIVSERVYWGLIDRDSADTPAFLTERRDLALLTAKQLPPGLRERVMIARVGVTVWVITDRRRVPVPK